MSSPLEHGLGPLCEHDRYRSRCVDCGAPPLNAETHEPPSLIHCSLTAGELVSLREWLASWGDGPNWSDATGLCVPIAKVTLTRLLNTSDALKASST